jgi:hypothetical protein
MDYFYIVILIILLFFSVKEIKKNKALSNDSIYNLYQNSRNFRLLIMFVACSILVSVFILRKILVLFNDFYDNVSN